MTQADIAVHDRSAVDAALADLVQGERRWAALPLSGRRDLLDEVRRLAVEHAQDWVDAAVGIKGLAANSPLVGEEWLSGPYPVVTAASALSASLARLDAGESPLEGARFGLAPGGRVTVEVLPLSVFDALLLSGFSAKVWLRPGVDEAQARQGAGLAQRDPTRTQGIGVVLGAGNITSIAPLDALYELFAHNRVVLLKLNPVTDALLPVLRLVLAPFIALGAVRIITGGAGVGAYVVNHPSVAHVHMTGSAATHDAIVFGTGSEGAARKAANQPLLDKPISSELGGVSPTIVLPGRWSRADLRFQAEHVATQRLHNGGYNCVASQVVVLAADWEQKAEFLAEVRRALDEIPARAAYYPGSDDRMARAEATYPRAARLGRKSERLMVTDLTPEEYSPLLTTEYFAPVLGVIELLGQGEAFLASAVETVNDQFTGTLGVNLIAHPKTIHDLGDAFEEAVAALRYGTIAINAWTGVGYLTATATWGAFPGHALNDVQSGIGIVHNALLIDQAERTVVRGPFRPLPRSLLNGEMSISPKPPWFVTNRTAGATARLLTQFAGDPKWTRLPAIFTSALLG